MEKSSKILIAGGTGMVGSAIIRRLIKGGFTDIHATWRTKTPQKMDHSLFQPDLKVSFNYQTSPIIWHKVDLTRQMEVEKLYSLVKPDVVIIAAARVGGILANDTYRAQFIYENLAIETNLIHAAHIYKIKKLLFLGSSCIYPKNAPQPMREDYLLTGELEPTNEPYAIAKIAGIKLCENYYRQYGDNFISVMPTNLYGPNDNFDPETAHVIPSLIHKFHEAKIGNGKVTIFGTGKPRREFLHVDDLTGACIYILKNLDATQLYSMGISHINVGTGKDITISELVKLIASIIEVDVDIVYNKTKPSGVKQKLLDITRIKGFGWKPKVALENGIRDTYDWYLKAKG